MSRKLIALEFDKQRRRFLLGESTNVLSLCWQPYLEVDGETVPISQAERFECEFTEAGLVRVVVGFDNEGIELTLLVTSGDALDRVEISGSIRNTGNVARRLGRLSLVNSRDEKLLVGRGEGETVFLNFTGDQGLHQVKSLAREAGSHRVRHLAHFYRRDCSIALTLGFVTFDRITTAHTFKGDGSGGIADFDSFCDFWGFELPPGATVETERLIIELADDPYSSLERWADRVREHYCPTIPAVPPAGWVGWSWVDGFTVEQYESVVLRNARALRERLAGFDIQYIWVSIGNLEGGLPGNWLKFNYRLFPGGVENLVSQLEQLGFKLGFWVAPFWVNAHAMEVVEELAEAIVRDEAGDFQVTCAEWNYGDAAALPRGKRPPCYSLDGSHPKTLEFLRHVFTTYRDWGVRYYMIDFLHGGLGRGDKPFAAYYDRSLIPGPQVYRHALAAVRAAAGSDTYLLCSSGPTVLNTGLVEAARVGSDYGEGRALHPDSYFYPATFVINDPDFWSSHKYATTNMAGTYFTHRKLYINDSGNVMTVDKPIPCSEARIVATVFGINGGPMMIGDDVDRMSEERLALIKKCLPRGTTMAFPVDLFEAIAPDYPRLFHLRIDGGWDSWDLVAVFNYDDEPFTYVLNFARLGLESQQPFLVWEFWNEQFLGTHAGTLKAHVAPRSVCLFRLSPCRNHPWILSTDMHVRQGEFDITHCEWNANELRLHVGAHRPPGETGNVFVHAPKGFRVTNPQGLWIAKDGHDQSLIIRKTLCFEKDEEEFELGFAAL